MPRPRSRSAHAYNHDAIANRLAMRLGTEHRRKGVDIVFNNTALEVAVSKDDIRTSIPQLKRSRARKKYMVVPCPLTAWTKKALTGTGIGIATTGGKIVKRSRRRAR